MAGGIAALAIGAVLPSCTTQACDTESVYGLRVSVTRPTGKCDVKLIAYDENGNAEAMTPLETCTFLGARDRPGHYDIEVVKGAGTPNGASSASVTVGRSGLSECSPVVQQHVVIPLTD